MASIYKRKGNKFWWVSYKDAYGRWRVMSTHTTSKSLANDIRKQKELDEIKAKHNLLEQGEASIDEFCNRYLTWIKDRKRYETFKTYKGVLKLFNEFLKTRPGIKKLKDISVITIEDYLTYLLKDHKRYTHNNHLKALKTMFNMAIDWRYLSVNPCDKVKPLELTDKKPIKYLTDDDYAHFMRVCTDEFPEFFATFYTFIHTGMRSGELFNLKWEDIDFQNKVIYIRQKAGFIPKGKDNSTHEAKQRIIPVHDSLVEVLKSVKRKSEYVFVDGEGNRFSKHKPRRTLIRIAKIAGIDGISRLHELRHTFATQIMAKKGDIYRLKELLGHSDIRDTMKYVHTSTESLRDDVKALEGLDRRAVPAYILHENSLTP